MLVSVCKLNHLTLLLLLLRHSDLEKEKNSTIKNFDMETGIVICSLFSHIKRLKSTFQHRLEKAIDDVAQLFFASCIEKGARPFKILHNKIGGIQNCVEIFQKNF